MVRVPSCSIDRPIYIWLMEIKLKDTGTPLHICRQGLPSFILISNTPHCWAIKKGSLWNKLAWWPLPPAGTVHPHASAHSDHQSPPRSTPPCLISHLSFFSITFSRYQFSDKILEISLVFTHGITPAWVNHNRCFVKNAYWCSMQCTRILLVIVNLACNYKSCLQLYNTNHE